MQNQTSFSQSFVNAFEEFNERNRKLFNVPKIDECLSFENKKNVCLILNSSKSSATSFLHSIITNACVNYHTTDNDNSQKRTIMIDAGNGNNFGQIYLQLVQQSMKNEFDNNKILNQIIVARAFTFYQLLNIVINELPKQLSKLESCKIQIIVLDLLDTLISSNGIRSKHDVEKSKAEYMHNEILVDELIDTLVNLSNKYFVIMWYDNSNQLIDDYSINSRFDNVIEINSGFIDDGFNTIKSKKRITNKKQHSVKVRIKSIRTTISANL